jgi:hypothetical protein
LGSLDQLIQRELQMVKQLLSQQPCMKAELQLLDQSKQLEHQLLQDLQQYRHQRSYLVRHHLDHRLRKLQLLPLALMRYKF